MRTGKLIAVPQNRPKRRTIGNIHKYSARKLAFALFDDGDKYDLVSLMTGLPPESVARYYRSWRKLPKKYDLYYLYLRELLRTMDKRELASFHQALADELGCDVNGIKIGMCRPWAIKQLLTGKWRGWEVTKMAGQGGLIPKFKRTAKSMTQTKNVKQALDLISKARPD